MDRYEVVVMTDRSHPWTMMFHAENFAHAEEQAQPYVASYQEIVSINKEATE